MPIKVAFKTDRGRIRDRNEDSLCALLRRKGKVRALLVVADGMGGHQAGDLASSKAVQIMRRYLLRSFEEEVGDRLERGVELANDAVRALSLKNPRYSGMGTTLTAAAISGDEVFIAHVGDSRAYLIREGRIEQITQDHSLVAEMVRDGDMTEEEARTSPERNVVTRAVGLRESVEVFKFRFKLREGDRLLLCSDGLTDLVDDEEILRVVLDSKGISKACRELVKMANDRGGYDNITVIIAQMGRVRGRLRRWIDLILGRCRRWFASVLC